MDADALAAILAEAGKHRAPAMLRLRSATNWTLADDDGSSWITSAEARNGLVRVETACSRGPCDVQVIDPAEVAVVNWRPYDEHGHGKPQGDGGGPAPERGGYL